jgi:hypothetical protein
VIRKGEREISEAAERLCSISHQHLESDTTIRPCKQRAAEMHRNYLHETIMAEEIGREHVREEDTASLSASNRMGQVMGTNLASDAPMILRDRPHYKTCTLAINTRRVVVHGCAPV